MTPEQIRERCEQHLRVFQSQIDMRGWSDDLCVEILESLYREAMALLRKEHNAVVRLVEKHIALCRRVCASYPLSSETHKQGLARWQQCVDILDQLKRRAT